MKKPKSKLSVNGSKPKPKPKRPGKKLSGPSKVLKGQLSLFGGDKKPPKKSKKKPKGKKETDTYLLPSVPYPSQSGTTEETLALLQDGTRDPTVKELAARIDRIERALGEAGVNLPFIRLEVEVPVRKAAKDASVSRGPGGRLEITPEELELANFDTLVEIQELIQDNFGVTAGITETLRKKPRAARQKIAKLLTKVSAQVPKASLEGAA